MYYDASDKAILEVWYYVDEMLWHYSAASFKN